MKLTEVEVSPELMGKLEKLRVEDPDAYCDFVWFAAGTFMGQPVGPDLAYELATRK